MVCYTVLKPQLDDAQINRLQQAAFRFYFKPADNDLLVTSKQLGKTVIGLIFLEDYRKGNVSLLVKEKK